MRAQTWMSFKFTQFTHSVETSNDTRLINETKVTFGFFFLGGVKIKKRNRKFKCKRLKETFER